MFPNVNIFGYTLLPGHRVLRAPRTSIASRRVAVAGYGKAKGEYVVGCHTFSRDEGEEGYFLIASYIVLARGQILARTVQLLALTGRVPVAALLRSVLRALLEVQRGDAIGANEIDRIRTYENRADVYLDLLDDSETTYEIVCAVVIDYLERHGAADLIPGVLRVLEIDQALCPRRGERHRFEEEFGFAAALVEEALGRMSLPEAGALEANAPTRLVVEHPGGVGEVLRDPDGGQWVRGRFVADGAALTAAERTAASA